MPGHAALAQIAAGGPLTADPACRSDGQTGPESEALLADSVGLAMLIVLDKLEPAERVAFVLHDMFDLPFGQIAGITGRSPAAARQLASRARRRVRGTPSVTGAGLPGGGRWSRPSWPPRAVVTSRRCSRCLIRTSRFRPTKQPRRQACRGS